MTKAAVKWSRFVAAERILNCRDLGGYPARPGKQVRRGLIFRSGEPGAPSEADIERLRELGLALMFDMRSNRERSARPNLGAPRLAVELMVRDYDHSRANLVEQARAGSASPARVAALMIETYRRLPYEQAESIGLIFEAIAQGRLPLLVHCAAGKDRTGIAAALLLDLLGVDRETICADFLLTNQFFDRIMRRFLAKSGFEDSERDLWAPLVRADPSYLAAMFATIDEEHGGTAGFLCEAAGIDDSVVTRIKLRLLEPA